MLNRCNIGLLVSSVTFVAALCLCVVAVPSAFASEINSEDQIRMTDSASSEQTIEISSSASLDDKEILDLVDKPTESSVNQYSLSVADSASANSILDSICVDIADARASADAPADKNHEEQSNEISAIGMGELDFSVEKEEASTGLSLQAADDPDEVYRASHFNIYRLYNPHSGEHLYTTNLSEARNISSAGWRWEGIGWVSPKQGNPVYRLYNPHSGDHHYTLSAGERDNLVSIGWRYEGVGFMSDATNGIAIYRQFNPNEVIGTHNFTKSQAEDASLGKAGWRREGVAYYATKGPDIEIQGFWLVTASWGKQERYWIDSSGNIAKSRFIETSEGSGWTAYATSSGAVVRGKGAVKNGVVVADNDGRIAQTANGKTGWLITKSYDSTEQRYYYDAATRCMRVGFFTIDGHKYYGDPQLGYVARNRLFHAGNTWYWANNDGSYTVETDPKARLLRALDNVNSSSALTTFGSVSFNWNTAEGQRLQSAVNSLRSAGESVGFTMIDLNTGTGITCSPNQNFYSASAIKGPYVAAINHYAPNRVNDSVRSLMSDTIYYSSNSSYESLRYMFGGGVMSSQLAYSGVSSFDGSAWYPSTSSRELAKLWVGNYWYFYEDKNSNSDWCRSLYTTDRSGENSVIYNALGSKYTVHAKPGWFFGGSFGNTRNDAGVVMASNGAYVVSVMSSAVLNASAVTNLVRAIDGVHSRMY